MSMALDIIVSALLVIGALFTAVGGYGMLKLSNPMSRLHAPTKAGTLGVGSILAASMIYSFANGQGSVNEMLILAFLFVTAPVSALFISKVNIHRSRTGTELPSPESDDEWATLSARKQEEG